MERVLFATFGSVGDVHPYIAVAKAVRQLGGEPTIATIPMHAARIRLAGIALAEMRPDFSGLDEAELFRRANDARRGTEFVVRELVMPSLRQSYDDLLAAAKSADLLVSHPLVLAAPLVVEKTGIPWASTVLSPTSLSSTKEPPVVARAPWLYGVHRVFPPLHRLFLGDHTPRIAHMVGACAQASTRARPGAGKGRSLAGRPVLAGPQPGSVLARPR